jgi:threonine/homoserine/homoserine lactone efflux protein
MLGLPPILVAALTGFISGLLLSIPVGPVNLTIINEGARRGFVWALLIGLGASLMEVIYCAIAFTGFSSFFDDRMVKASMEVFSFAFMLFLGIKFMMAKTVAAPMHISNAADRIEERIGEKLHPHSAFMTGFVRVMGNPGVLLFWIILATNFMSHDWVQPNLRGKLACVAGVALGTGLWFLGLSYAVSRGHGKFSEKTLLKVEHFSGAALLGLGLIHGAHIAWQLAKHKM